MKPVGLIFIIAVGIGISTFFVFGVYGPSEYLIPKVIEETTEEIAEMIEPTSPIFAISILSGSSEQRSSRL